MEILATNHNTVPLQQKRLRSEEAIMCLKKMLKCSHMLPMLCILVYSLWFFLVKTNYDANDQQRPASTKSLLRADVFTETRDIRHKYTGPYHRYHNVNGTWKRIRPEVAVHPITPSRIPHVIHQTWDTSKVPDQFARWVLSWVRQHPTWEYWFWTPRDVEELIGKNYPAYLNTYKSYSTALSRADASRYFILHTFGGLYADLDMQSLRPIDELVDAYPCILTEETHEHAHLLYFRNPANLMTAIMACQPDHPLFLVAIRALPYAQKRFPNRVIQATGPLFLDAVYQYFINQSSPVAGVQILPPEYLLPTYDPGQSSTFSKICGQLTKSSATYLHETCKRWNDERRLNNKPSKKSYAVHYWIHVVMKEKYWKHTKAHRIDLILNAKTKSDKTKKSS